MPKANNNKAAKSSRSGASTPSLRSFDGADPRNDAGNVRVVVRVRSFLPREIERNAECLVRMDAETQSTQLLAPNENDPANARALTRSNEDRTFTFDNSFWSHGSPSEPNYATQEHVYSSLGEGFLDHNFEGYHTCILAYGQTGSGKSYTMMGLPGDADQAGLIPRTCMDLFDRIDAAKADGVGISYHVQVSYFEVYNEHVFDLLKPHNPPKKLKVREHTHKGGTVYVEGLFEPAVSSLKDILHYMRTGDKNRTTGSTKMNDESSRSHSVFTISLKQVHHDMETDSTTERNSNIRLVDLAGSERADKTGAQGERFKEGANINRSLSALGNVIRMLAEAHEKPRRGGRPGKSVVIPYRDSVLTWLLKDSLSGNSKTAMVACIAPADYEETLSTLRYASVAKKIRTRAIVNEQGGVKEAERDAHIAAMAEEIAKLQQAVETGARREAKDLVNQEEALQKWKSRVDDMQALLQQRSMVAESKIRNLQSQNETLRLHLKLAVEELTKPIHVRPPVKEDDRTVVEEDGGDDGYESGEYDHVESDEIYDHMQALLKDLGMFRRKIGDDKHRFLGGQSGRQPPGLSVQA